MIKNPELLRRTEASILRQQRDEQPFATKLQLLDEMTRFARRFPNSDRSHEDDSHVNSLVRMTDCFRVLREQSNA